MLLGPAACTTACPGPGIGYDDLASSAASVRLHVQLHATARLVTWMCTCRYVFTHLHSTVVKVLLHISSAFNNLHRKLYGRGWEGQTIGRVCEHLSQNGNNQENKCAVQ